MQTKFTATFQFDSEAILSFAKFLGYQDGYEATPEEYLSTLFKEHANQFTTTYAKSLVDGELEKAKEQLDLQIVQPIKEAISISYETVE